MARKFLYVVAAIIVVVLAALVVLRLWSGALTEMAFVPDAAFTPQAQVKTGAYSVYEGWIARPGMGANNPASWMPPDFEEDADALAVPVFFVHPTSYFEKAAWNAPEGEKAARDLADLFVRGMASPFNKSIDLWAPRYRQAAIGAFLTDKPESAQALDLAYGDVLAAFDHFIATVDPDKPIVLAGHSQGAFHLLRLLRERASGKPLAKRIVAAYLIGWPVSPSRDLPAIGLPACAAPSQTGCVVSWLSVAEPAETDMLVRAWQRRTGLDEEEAQAARFVCTNPLTGKAGGEAPASANFGTLVPDIAARTGRLVAKRVGARCREDGFLSIGEPPELGLGPYVMPGNNFHVFDVTLFWANLRADFVRRVKAWRPAQP
jgi:Protein of unknown function (DUF3089)